MQHPLPINKGLLDAWSAGRTFHDLSRNFYPVEFFDLCSIIEELVLRDEIVLVGKYTMLPRHYQNALQPFVSAGVFRTVIVSTQILRTDATDDALRMAAEHARRNHLTSASLRDADMTVTRLLGAEIDLRIPTIALLQHLHNYQFVRRPLLDNTVCDLVSRYSDLKERVDAAKAIDFGRLGLKQIKVPPIALEVLQRAYSYDQLSRSILEVRDKFRPVREAMHMLAETLADTDLDSDELLGLLAKWERRWQKLFDAVPSCSLDLGKTAATLLTEGVSIARAMSGSASPISGVFAGLKIFREVPNFADAFALRPVHLSVNNYLRTHPHRMISAVSRIFDRDPRHVRRLMEAVGSSPSSVWRQALAGRR